jgi:hypothetical protein
MLNAKSRDSSTPPMYLKWDRNQQVVLDDLLFVRGKRERAKYFSLSMKLTSIKKYFIFIEMYSDLYRRKTGSRMPLPLEVSSQFLPKATSYTLFELPQTVLKKIKKNS